MLKIQISVLVFQKIIDKAYEKVDKFFETFTIVKYVYYYLASFFVQIGFHMTLVYYMLNII